MQVMVGLSIIRRADDQVVAALPYLSASQARELLADLRALPPVPELVDCDDQCQRLQTIAEISTIARFGPMEEGPSRSDPTVPLPSPAGFGFQPPIHFDDLLRQYNRLYDRRIAACRLATFSQRRAAFAAFEADRAAALAKLTGSSSTAALQRFLLTAVERTGSHSIAQDKDRQKSRLTQLALILVVFRADHGVYPASLAELSATTAPVGTAPASPELRMADRDIFADDQPVRYLPAESLIYSIGPNQRDDLGVYARPKLTGSFADLLAGAAPLIPDYPDDIAVHLP
jgi:hypothetical protein